MTQRRKGMLVLLVILVVLPASGIGLIGVVETTLWLLMLAAWLAVFLTWGGKEPRPSRPRVVDSRPTR